jgi:hypothetical protein
MVSLHGIFVLPWAFTFIYILAFLNSRVASSLLLGVYLFPSFVGFSNAQWANSGSVCLMQWVVFLWFPSLFSLINPIYLHRGQGLSGLPPYTCWAYTPIPYSEPLLPVSSILHGRSSLFCGLIKGWERFVLFSAFKVPVSLYRRVNFSINICV